MITYVDTYPATMHGVPLKAVNMTSSARPNASNICAPWYDVSSEMPILDRIFNSPLSTAFLAADHGL